MGEDIVEFKPGFGPVKVNVIALWRRLFAQSKDDPVAQVALRFLKLFQWHGVAITQIPRLIPQISLEKLKSTELLLPVLTTEVIEQAATLFGIRRAWLEGADSRMYNTFACYKQPRAFFEELASVAVPANRFAVRALCAKKALDYRQRGRQPLAIVLVERILDLDEQEITRYRICGDAWDWTHPPCRIELKAIARQVFLEQRCPVPLHYVEPAMLEKVLEGTWVPHDTLKGCLLTEPSLEDYALSAAESVKAKETAELPEVLSYIEHHKLDALSCPRIGQTK